MGYNGESAEDKKKRWEQAIEEGRKKAESGNRYIQYMNEHFGITEQQKKAAYEASGMDLLRRDLTALDNDLRTKPQTAQRGRVSGMISALQKQRAYFSKYADYFSAEELRGFDDELQRHEARLKGTMTAMEQRAAQTAEKKTTAQSQPLTVAETAQRGAALGAPRGRVEMPIDRTQRRQLGFLTPQEQREAVRRGEELQKTYGDLYDVEHAAKKKQEAEVKARQLYERKKAYIDKKEAEGWNSPQEKENEYRRLEYYSRRLGTAQAEKMRFDAVQKEYGEAKTMENLSARMQEVGQQIAASQQREQQLEAQLRKAKAPSGRRVGNEWVSEEPDTAEIERIGKELKTEQRRQRILEGQQKRVVTDYQAVYYYKYTALQNREDFEEKSQYRTTKKDKVRNGLESTYGDIYYDYINGDPQAQTIVRVQDDNNTKATHEMWKNLPEETVRIFDYLYATEGKDAAYEYLDLTVEKEYTWMQAIGYGVAKGTGLASLYYAGKKGVASFFGGEAEEKSAIMDYRQFNEEAAGAARDYPISYYAGSAVGNLALMAATGGAAGKIVGAAGGAIGSRVATGALSFATAQAIRDAGDAATGEITGGQFAKNILVGGIQGAAGNLAYELVSSGIAQKLTGARERTLFMEFIRNTAASMSFSTVNQAIGYIAADEKPSAGEVASGLISSFAFAMIDGGLRTLRTTQAAKQELERMRDEVMEQYMLLTQNGKQLSPQQAAERVLAVYQYSRDIQTKLNETYLAGQEDAIAQMQLGLDSAAAWAYDWLSEYQGAAAAGNAPSAQSGGMNGGMPLLPDMTGTGQSEQPAPTQPQGGGTTEQVRQLQTEIAQAMTEGVNAGETAAGNNSKKPAVNSTMSEIRNEQKGAIGNERTENLREGGGRNLRLDSGIQAGSMEKGGSYFPADSGGAGDGESDRAANLRAERINNRIAQFGRLNWSTVNSEVIKGGDPETYCAVIPEDRYEPEMQKAAERARQAGVSVTYVAGPLNVTGRDGEYYGAEAVYDPEAKKIVAKADSVSFDPERLIEHELFHDRANGRPELVREIADEIRKNFDEAEFNRIAELYLQTYRGAVDGSTETVEEEILADAYAGMNRFRDMNTAQYRETVQRAADSPRYIPPTNENAAALARRGVGDDSDKFSIAETKNGKKYVRADRQVIFGNDPEVWSEQVEDYINGKIRRGGNVKLIGADGDELTLTATSAGKLSDNHTADGRTMSDDAFYQKANAAVHIDELAQVSYGGRKTVEDHDGRHGEMASGGWNYRTAYFEDFDGKYYRLTISVAQNAEGKMLYNIGIIKEEAHPKIMGSRANNDDDPRGFASSANSIRQGTEKSQEGGVKFSLANESDGEYLSLAEKYRDGTASEEETKRLQEMVDAAAEAALEDSEARMEPWNRWDGGGKLVKVYHTTNEQFTVFDRKKLGGMTDNNASTPLLAATAHVGHWFNTSATKVKERARTKHTIAAYLDIKRPYVAGTVEGLANDIEEYTDAEPGEDWDYEGYTPKRIAKRFIDHLEWNGYDGVVVSKDEEFGGTSFVVLNSDQIKSADPVTYDNEGKIIPLSERFRKDRKGKNAWKNKDIRFSLAASETVGKLTAANNLSEADLREGLSSGAITLSDNDREGEVSVIYRSGSEVNGTVPIGSVQQVILPRSSKLGTFRDLAEMGINVTDYTANDEYGRERHVNKALGMEGRQTQSEAMQTAAQRIEKERIESLSDADAPREKTEKQDERTEQIEEMRRSPNDVRRRIGGALEAYMKRQQDLKEEKKRFGTDYGFQKPLWSRSTKLSPMEAVETLESATGHQWSIQRRRDGTWKAVQQEGLALAPRYSKEEALRRLEDNKRSTLADPVVSTTAEGTAKKAFVATPAMEKLGIKIDGSVADYEATPEILASARARKQIESSVKKLMKRNGWENSSAEAKFAWCIANGKVSVQDIPKRMDYRAVNELANLYMSERMLGEDLLTMRKRAIRNGVLDEVMRLFPSEKSIKAGTATFRSESLLTMNYRTARRSMLRIFGDEAGEKINKYLFDPVIRNTAEQMRWTNRQLDRMRTFESADGKQEKLNKAESKYVHMLLDLEGYREKINRSENKRSLLAAAENLTGKLGKTDDLQSAVRDEAREFGLGSEETAWVTKYAQYLAEKEKAGEKDSGIDTEKCERARAAYRKAFDEYYDAIVDLLVAHGEQPIGKIEFYAPHMTTNDKVNLLSNLLETMGFNENATTLPASIAGITEDLRPNKRWTPFFQHRTGDKTEYDIVGAFESYLSYIGDVIFHIDDIRKLRITESFLRQGVAGDFTGALDTALRMSRSGDLEERERFLTDVGQIGDDELLTEQEIGQRIDNLIEELIGEQKNNTRYSGLVDWLKTYTDILAGKQYSGDRGLEHAVGRVGPGAKILNVMNQAGRLFGMSKVAGNISTILNQSAQLPLLMATRSKRSILRAIGEFTSGRLKDFTLESDFLTGKRGISYINSKTSEKILSGMFAGAEFTDRLLSTIAARAAYLDAVTGQKGLQQMDHEDAMRFADSYARGLMGDRTKGAKPVAFHSKNPLMQMVNRFQIENLNSWEFLLRDVPEELRKVQREHGKAAAIKALIGVIVETLIAAFIMNRLTEEAYGGTPAPFDLIGLSANFIASGNGLSTNDGIRYLFNQASKELFGEEVFENVPEPSESFDLGRAASDTAQNVSNDIPFVSNIASIVGWGDKTMPLPDLYGSGKEIVDAIRESGWFSRDANLAALGFLAEILPGGNQMQKTAKGLLALKEGGRVSGRTDKERLQFATDDDIANVIRQALFGVYSTPEAKAFYASGRSGLSTKQTTLWRELREDGVDGTELYETMQTIRAIDKRDDLTTPQQGAAKRKLINEANLTDGQKARLYSVMISDSRDDDFGQMMEAEMSWAQIMEAYEKYKELYDDEELSAAEQALEMAQWIEKQKYSKTQKQLVKEAFKFYSFTPANTDVYDNYVAAGVSPDEAKRIVAQTKKNAGDDSVATEDKVNAILGQKMSEKKTYAALGTVLSEGAYEKLTEAYRAGISCEVFFKFYRMAQEATSERDGDGKEIKGKTRKDKIIAYIDSLNLTDEQKNTLLLTEYPKAKPEDMRWSKTKWNGN